MAIVLPVALRGITLALAMGSSTTRRTEATLLVQSKLAELVATGAWQDSDLEGDFSQTPSGETLTTSQDEGTTTFSWAATAEDWLDQSVKELTVRVMWESRGAQSEVVLTTLVFTEGQ